MQPDVGKYILGLPSLGILGPGYLGSSYLRSTKYMVHEVHEVHEVLYVPKYKGVPPCTVQPWFD